MTKLGRFVFYSLLPLAARADLNRLPLQFEENQGQAAPEIQFLSRGHGYAVALSADQAWFRAGDSPVTIRLEGANPRARGAGEGLLPGRSNYLRGSDPALWRTNLPNYERVRYSSVYPGIDLVYYGNGRELEYDFVLQPGADAARIVLAIEGVQQARVDAAGDLVLNTASGIVRQKKPALYQTAAGARRKISGGYRVLAGNRIGFQPGSYDRKRPLIIDPILQFSTFYGGQLTESAKGIAVDNNGGLYIAGTATSLDFPVTPGVFQNKVLGNTDVFVVKMNTTGTSVAYSTLIGGSDDETCAGVRVDPQGNAYVAGTTRSVNFPTTAGAYKERALGGSGDSDGFVVKLNTTGSNLIWSTRIGGKAQDALNGFTVDPSGYVFVTGDTLSSDFPISSDDVVQKDRKGYNDAFVTKLKNDGTAIIYSTLLGGDSDSFIVGFESGKEIAVDRIGQVYVAGITTLRDFPITSNAIQNIHLGQGDVFVTKISTDGKAILYSTFLGGEGNDTVNGIYLDTPGTNLYVVGETNSLRFPTTPQVFQNFQNGGGDPLIRDAFVTKINASGQAVYSTYFGGRGDDQLNGVVADDAGNAYVIGTSSSSDLPTTFDAIQKNISGGTTGEPFDAFVAQLDPNGMRVPYATYLGGPRNDQGNAITRDSDGNLYVAGYTQSSGFPLTPGALQRTTGFGTSTAFIARIGESRPGATVLSIVSGNGQSADQGTRLKNPLVVGLTDMFGTPVTGGAINFAATNAVLSGSTVATDGRGRAQVLVTVGNRPGPVTVTAQYAGVPPVTFNLTSVRTGPPLPEISTNGVFSAGGSSPPLRALSAGAIGKVVGQALAFPGTNREVEQEDLVDGKLPVNFQRTCITVGGTAARLIYVSDREIRFQTPDLGTIGNVPVVVITNCGQFGELRSDPQTIEIRSSSPEFYSWGPAPDGRPQAMALNDANGAPLGSTGSVAGLTLTAARPDMVVAAFGTGFGPTNPAIPAGEFSSARAGTVEIPVVILDGIELPAENVLYSGLLPDFPGTNQVNFRIPAGVRNGLLSLQIRFALNQSPVSYLRVSGGLDLDPRISASPSRVDFGDVVVGQSRELPLTIANAGTFPLTITALVPGLPILSISPNFGFRLAPGEARVFTMRLNAQSVGTLTTEIQIGSDDPIAPVLKVPVTVNVVPVPPTPNPFPVISSLSPNSVQAGGAPFNLVVNGTGFVRGSVVEVNGKPRSTFFNHDKQLIALVQAQDIIEAGALRITVNSPPPGGGRSQDLILGVQGVVTTGRPLGIINQFDLRFCPLVTSFVTVLDSGGAPVRNITNDSITCTEDGLPLGCTVAPAAAEWPVSLDLVYGVQGLNSDQDFLLLKGATRNFITQLRDVDRISILHLEDVARPQLPFTEDKDRAINVLELLHPVPGGNALYDAVVNSAQATQRETGRRRIVLLIATQDNLSGILTDLNQALGTARATGVTFYTIVVGPNSFDVNLTGFLRQLARDTGGQFFAEPSSLNFAGLLGRLSLIIQSQLTVTHYANALDNRTKTLNFTFRIPEGTVTASRTYAPCLP